MTILGEHVRAVVFGTPSGGSRRMAINLEIADGWKLFGAGSDHGVPVSLRTEPPERLRDVIVPAGELTGAVQLRATLDDAATRLWLRYQLCGGALCHPPAEVELPV